MEKLRLIKDEILFVGHVFSKDRHLRMGDFHIKICVLFFFTKNEGAPHWNPGSSWRQWLELLSGGPSFLSLQIGFSLCYLLTPGCIWIPDFYAQVSSAHSLATSSREFSSFPNKPVPRKREREPGAAWLPWSGDRELVPGELAQCHLCNINVSLMYVLRSQTYANSVFTL